MASILTHEPMVTLSFILVVLAGFGLAEFLAHLRARQAIPIRIHVNGTRGKSSVTRLIAAGLRAGGIPTLAKSTGAVPRLIFPDGHEEAIRRRGMPNILEQLVAFRRARKVGARAVVVECMALRPDFQRLTEERMIDSTIGVITNVRADHLDVMGPSLRMVARALSQTIPRRRTFATAEDDGAMQALLLKEARRRGNRVVVADGTSISNEMMSGFPYLEHRSNVALALAVCQELGVASHQALHGMHRVTPDPGVLRTYRFTFRSTRVEFIDALSANDPDSIMRIWSRMAVRFHDGQTKIILLNNRKDRLPRSYGLVRCISEQLPVDCVVLTGEDQPVVRRLFERFVSGRIRIVECGQAPARFVYRRVMQQCTRENVVFAIGNIGGVGHELVAYFDRASQKHA